MKIETSESSNKFSLIGIVITIIIIVLFYFCWKFISNNFYDTDKLEKNDCELEKYHGKISSELEPALINMGIKSYPLEAKQILIDQIYNSRDLQSYSLLFCKFTQ